MTKHSSTKHTGRLTRALRILEKSTRNAPKEKRKKRKTSLFSVLKVIAKRGSSK